MRIQLCVLAAGVLLAAPAFAKTDAEFVNEAASGGLMEVKLGEYAATHASDSDVAAFGRKMAADHGKANEELMSVAKEEGLSVPAAMNEKHARMAQELLQMQGAEFDKAYARMMVEDHEKDVEAFRDQAREAKSGVDRWAAKTAPTLESHLLTARKIHERVNGTAGTSGKRGGVGDVDHGDDPAGRMGPGAAVPDTE
jgi:putative membrane protein